LAISWGIWGAVPAVDFLRLLPYYISYRHNNIVKTLLGSDGMGGSID
jgi:hypothetical protein